MEIKRKQFILFNIFYCLPMFLYILLMLYIVNGNNIALNYIISFVFYLHDVKHNVDIDYFEKRIKDLENN